MTRRRIHNSATIKMERYTSAEYNFIEWADMEEMNAKAEEHLQYIKEEFTRLVDPKYRKGQEEHGGILNEKSAEFLTRNRMCRLLE